MMKAFLLISLCMYASLRIAEGIHKSEYASMYTPSKKSKAKFLSFFSKENAYLANWKNDRQLAWEVLSGGTTTEEEDDDQLEEVEEVEEDDYSMISTISNNLWKIVNKMLNKLRYFLTSNLFNLQTQKKASTLSFPSNSKRTSSKKTNSKRKMQNDDDTKNKNNKKNSNNKSTIKNSQKQKSTSTLSTSGISSSNHGLLRIQRERESFLQNPPAYCQLITSETLNNLHENEKINANLHNMITNIINTKNTMNSNNNNNNVRNWVVQITGPPDTIYAGETYFLQVKFPINYPNKPPAVFFLPPVPKHKHVYPNGDICLNLLGKDWRPIMTAEGLIVSILSMLSSAKDKQSPPDNAAHAHVAPGGRQEYLYHDDKC